MVTDQSVHSGYHQGRADDRHEERHEGDGEVVHGLRSTPTRIGVGTVGDDDDDEDPITESRQGKKEFQKEAHERGDTESGVWSHQRRHSTLSSDAAGPALQWRRNDCEGCGASPAQKLGMVVVTPFKMPTGFLPPAAAGCEVIPVETLQWCGDRGSSQ